MTGKQPQDDRQRLEALYREHGEAEPDAGIDWRIRAQAHREARRSSLPRPAHWLGGAALAASLFVVVSVVTQMEPPLPEFPETSRPQTEPAASRDPAAPAADRESRAPAEAARQRSAPAMRDRAADDAFTPAPPAASLLAEPAAEAEKSSGRLLEEGKDRTLDRLEQARVPLDPELGFSEAKALPESSSVEEIDRRLWLIEQFITLGDAERARLEVEAFRERYPDHDIPRSLLRALEALESPDGLE